MRLLAAGVQKNSDSDERGQLNKFFPQIPNANRITIGQILNRRSGMPPSKPTERFWGMQPRTQKDVVARIARNQPRFEPDARLGYSNAGYILLGYVVEKVGGKLYPEALKERITSKIGLKDTYVGTGSEDPSKNEATSYRSMGGWREAAELDFSVPGRGCDPFDPDGHGEIHPGLFDLKLVSAESLKQMTTMRDGEGMGLEPFAFAGKTLYGHTGGSGSSGPWLAFEHDKSLPGRQQRPRAQEDNPMREVVNDAAGCVYVSRKRATRNTGNRAHTMPPFTARSILAIAQILA